MPRREAETKAKAFAFVMDQLAWIGDDLKVDADAGKAPGGFRPAKLAYWEWLFPAIGTDSAKRGRWQADLGPTELLRQMRQPEAVLLGDARREKLRPEVLASFDLACALGWMLRSEEGPFAELFSSERHFKERFGHDVLARYLDLMAKDFAGCQPYLLAGLEEAVTSLELRGAGSQEGRVCSWDMSPAQYGSYLVRKHRAGGRRQDWWADLITMMLMASLLGPNDYRADLLVPTAEKYEDTSDAGVAPMMARAPRRLGVELRAFLTRVTFDRDPPNEQDYLVCEGAYEAEGGGAGRLMSIPLEGKRRVVMARSLPRFSDSGECVEIPLNCLEASSRRHLELSAGTDGWQARDLGSTNGTLVVSRDGTRHMLWRKVEGGDEPVALRNGDVICIAPEHRGFHAVPTNPAFLFHYATTEWH